MSLRVNRLYLTPVQVWSRKSFWMSWGVPRGHRATFWSDRGLVELGAPEIGRGDVFEEDAEIGVLAGRHVAQTVDDGGVGVGARQAGGQAGVLVDGADGENQARSAGPFEFRPAPKSGRPASRSVWRPSPRRSGFCRSPLNLSREPWTTTILSWM